MFTVRMWISISVSITLSMLSELIMTESCDCSKWNDYW